jgi:hypothetical protein
MRGEFPMRGGPARSIVWGMVLLLRPDGAPNGVYVARPVRWRDRVAARLRAARLDAALAAGADPDRDPALALRAQELTSPRRRRQLAGAIERVAAVAVGARSAGVGEVAPEARARVAALAPELRALAARVRGPGPVAVRGVAEVRMLLMDGAGALHWRARGLAEAIERAERALEI